MAALLLKATERRVLPGRADTASAFDGRSLPGFWAVRSILESLVRVLLPVYFSVNRIPVFGVVRVRGVPCSP